MLVGCEAPLPPQPPEPVHPNAPPSVFSQGPIRGHIGRGVAPQRVELSLSGRTEPPVLACDQHEIVGADQRLQRVGAKRVWTVTLAKTDTIVDVDACHTPIIVTVAGEHGAALISIDRATGKALGRIDDVTGVWVARTDDQLLEVATTIGVTRWDRSLTQPQPLELPPLGALIAERGDRRLVRATPTTAVLLDRDGIAAYLPISEATASISDTAIVTPDRTLSLPPRWKGPLLLARHAPLAVPAELRDLPAPVAAPIPTAAPFELGTKIVATVIVGTTMYVASDAGIAELDLAKLAWGWHVAGEALALAADRTTIAFATKREIVILDHSGSERIRIKASAETLDLAGVLLIAHTGSRARAYDAVTGSELGHFVSDDGASVRAVAFALDGMEILIEAERGRIVARLPRVWMVPAWSVEVAGVVKAIERSGDGALVVLEDGDAYRLDARTGAATAMPGIGLTWRASGDAVTGEAPGGPIPPAVIVPPKGPPEKYVPTDLEAAPALATPWPAPPPLPASWELTIYDQTGGMRVRNDYALADPVAGLRMGAAPFVYTAGQQALVIDAVRGDPLRRVTLSGTGRVFSTIVDGRAIVGMILAAPLRLVVF